MLQELIIPFLTIGLAELGDKTQLAILCLAAKTKKHLQLLLGAILAFIVADGIAILLGDFITNIIPISYIKAGAGIIFIIVGLVILLKSKEEEKKCDLKQPFLSGFSLILVSEFGDKTQLAAALFATKYNPTLVLIGVVGAMALLSVIAIYSGKFISSRIKPKVVHTISGVLFIIIGIASFF